jgi:hypothetical protein
LHDIIKNHTTTISCASRRRIGRIMSENNLVSNYTRMKYKVNNTRFNETKKSNLIGRQFDGNPQ